MICQLVFHGNIGGALEIGELTTRGELLLLLHAILGVQLGILSIQLSALIIWKLLLVLGGLISLVRLVLTLGLSVAQEVTEITIIETSK